MSNKRIKAIPSAGGEDGGQTIQWVFEYDDGSQETMQCPQELLSTLLQGLKLAGQIAEGVRAGVPPEKQAIHYAHNATSVRSGRDGENVVLQFGTQPGIPVQVSIPPDLARRTIQQIERSLSYPAQSRSGLN